MFKRNKRLAESLYLLMKAFRSSSQDSGSYRSILKSTSLIGGASVLNILIGMLRTKFVAVLLGPTGVGLLGMYIQIIDVVTTVTRMGIGNSGVRQVAEAVGSNDDDLIARTVITVRRTAWFTGGLGLLVMIAFSVPLSRMTFGTNEYASSIALLGITLFTGAIATAQGCLINGTRRIADLAKLSVIGATNGTLISVPCYYLWGQAGIVPSLILSAFATLTTSWWFARRVPVKAITFPWRDSCGILRQLLSLGGSFMGAGLVTALSGYLIRIVMLRQFSLNDLGIYQAAFSLSGVLVDFVLNAMGSDYYPRLTSVANNNTNVHRLVNEQSQISILLSLPGLTAMMIIAPLIIPFFYATSFAMAVPVLQWCIMGVLGKVFSWPLGFVMLAKGNGRLFFITEAIGASTHLLFVYIFCSVWGLNGAGIAFMAVYLMYTFLMLLVMHRLVGATWTRSTLNMTLTATTVMALLMFNCTFNKNFISLWIINLAVFAVVMVVCISCLSKRSGVGLNELLTKLSHKKL